MAYEIVRMKSILSAFNANTATTNFPNAQFTFVALNGSGQLVAPGAGKQCVGVLQDKPAVGDPGAVCYPGDITKIQCNAIIAAGTFIATDAQGGAVAATSGAYFLGQLLTAGAVGYLADMVFQPGYATP